jgi:hypothetical protein
MKRFITDRDVAPILLRWLGLEGQRVRSITLHCPVNGVVTADIEGLAVMSDDGEALDELEHAILGDRAMTKTVLSKPWPPSGQIWRTG